MSIPQTPSPLSNILAAKTYNAAWFSGSTKETQITAAIAAAVLDGALYVYIPANMLPYNASSVTFNPAIHMIREGGSTAMFDVKAYGAAGDGVTNDTNAFVNCHLAIPAGGGNIYGPEGTYLVDSDTWTISKSNVKLSGAGYAATVIRRRLDQGVELLNVTGTHFTASDLTLQDFLGATVNTGRLLHVNFLNDVEIHRVWFQFGYENVLVDQSTNVGFHQCTFESARRNNVRGHQSSDVRLTGCAFYTVGALAYDDGLSAQLLIEKDAGFAFFPFAWKVTGNTFFNSNIGHNIRAINTAGLTITGNTIDYAGLFDANLYDDIKLEGCRYTVIDGNTSAAEINTYSAGVRASRYNINLDANCRNTVIGANALKIGQTGGINDLAPDTVILPSLNAEGPRRFLTASTAYDPPLVAAGAQTTTTILVSGSIVGNPVSVGFDKDLQGMQLTGYVSVNGTVTVVLRNGTAGGLDLATGNLRVDVFSH